ncbi:MAG: D-2-hydroxyacid dehydrogenase [Myxococcales bacterium FL481]|nr:MAG: D-2-hydroxyacid dehydrogenase [Myxococcales bacterium FL481]
MQTPNIVVLDGHTLNPGDLSWSGLDALGEVTVYARSDRASTVPRAVDAEIVLTNKTVLDAEILSSLPKLRYVGVLATGINVVDLASAAERGIVVTNAPAYGTRAVAQATFALLLELCNHVGLHAQSVASGAWSSASDFCYWERPIVELAGQTLGVVGLGAIGRAVADLGAAFGMRVVAATRRGVADAGIPVFPVDDLVAQSDVVSLHCPLTPATARLIDARRLSRFRPHSVLINTARGGLLDEAAVADALRSGQLGGAAVDVLSTEPPAPDNPLLRAPNCIVTPHVAWASRQARARLLNIVVDNVAAFLRGEPRNQCRPSS